MYTRKYLNVNLFVVFICVITTISTENKTSSECWACIRPNTPHVLTCTGGGVISIQGAYYGYKPGCLHGITGGGGCSEVEKNRCCKPGGAGINCFKSFNIRDREELETVCSSKSNCIFNSTRHDLNYTCYSIKFTENSFTLINYTCQTQDTVTVQHVNVISSSTKKPIPTTTYYDTSETSPSFEDKTSSDGVKVTSSYGKTTSSEIAGIVLGVIAIVILLCIAAFLLYQRYENVNLVNNRQSELNHQQPRTRTVGVQYCETDFTYIKSTPDIPVSSSDTNASYSKLETLATEPVQYDQIIMNKTQKANTKNNASGYYNQQYVNM